MTSPRSTYGGGYYSASFPDTPIYDSLVAERGTPQIAPIRVPAAYDMPGSNLPALPSALPALPGGPLPARLRLSAGAAARSAAAGARAVHPAAGRRAARLSRAAAQQPRPAAPGMGTGYEAMRPAAPRPAPAAPYQDPYNNQQYRGY